MRVMYRIMRGVHSGACGYVRGEGKTPSLEACGLRPHQQYVLCLIRDGEHLCMLNEGSADETGKIQKELGTEAYLPEEGVFCLADPQKGQMILCEEGADLPQLRRLIWSAMQNLRQLRNEKPGPKEKETPEMIQVPANAFSGDVYLFAQEKIPEPLPEIKSDDKSVLNDALDDSVYLTAQEKPAETDESTKHGYTLKPRSSFPEVDRLPPLNWPDEIREMKIYFDVCPPIRVFDAQNGWRFVRAPIANFPSAEYCALGRLAENGQVTQIAYAIPENGRIYSGMLPGYRYQRGMDGRGYWTLWRKVGADAATDVVGQHE